MYINVQLMAINVLKKRAKRLSTYGAQECSKKKNTSAKRDVNNKLCESSVIY